MRHGKGQCDYRQDGSRFSGTWANNVPMRGMLSLSDGTLLDGEWRDNMYSGVGQINYACGDIFTGEWKMNVPNRYGKMVYRSGKEYAGEWNMGRK